ncbi:hypothetical protein C8R43DRAFT_3093 [Mycena crocata]|nr:hypothetical protein C8R43DRAFT_3093 [Mycena crocata]
MNYSVSGPSMARYTAMQQNFNASPGFVNAHDFLSQSTSQEHSLHQGTDPNSPELFKRNLELVRQNVIRLQEVARRALEGIQNAYCPGRTPTRTAVDLATLKQTMHVVSELMRHSGVGGLPLLLVPDKAILHTEAELVAQTARTAQTFHDQLRRSHDSAAIVANLLTSQ